MKNPCNRKTVTRYLCGASALALVSLTAAGARAQDKDIWERDKLTGTWNGARTALEQKGVDIGINYIGETFSILSGGLQRGTTYEGRLDVTINTDLQKLIGWNGAKTHVRAFQIHNVNGKNAADYAGSIADPSNIDALATTRLFTAWFEQEFGSLASIRIGQLAADDEFLVSNTAGGLINGTFGWATIMSANLPSGGPAYPLATPGVRVKIDPSENVSILGAVFSGDPAGANCSDSPQICNRYGTTFSFSGGSFWIAEAQYQVNREKDAKGPAAAYKIGVWYHSGNFADQHFGLSALGVPVTLAAMPVAPLEHRGNWGVYGVIDQMIWRNGQKSASIFFRSGFAPSERSLVSWYIDGGIGFKGPIADRPDDALTIGVAHSKISKDAIALDQDVLRLNGAPFPIRNAETVIELSYIAQIAPWWTVQPDFQYLIHPGGNVSDPNSPATAVKDAVLIGARSTITF